MTPQVLNVGTVDIQRGPSGEIEVRWPGWHLMSSNGTRMILGTGPGPHIQFPNEDGRAAEHLASLRVCPDADGNGGYTVADLARIADAA